ncbi:hypothetical protein TPAR_04964 [Tolypocladium paradoxum]|uniref:Uncharacterized protein n=1 Tax=Tolypocladium paradoxum TaxID=94208 RepID=A0A2S4KXH5_9HYPO|nr:hypothetical protein TPAR_04964 [Tolypocladium paradoxum]
MMARESASSEGGGDGGDATCEVPVPTWRAPQGVALRCTFQLPLTRCRYPRYGAQARTTHPPPGDMHLAAAQPWPVPWSGAQVAAAPNAVEAAAAAARSGVEGSQFPPISMTDSGPGGNGGQPWTSPAQSVDFAASADACSRGACLAWGALISELRAHLARRRDRATWPAISRACAAHHHRAPSLSPLSSRHPRPPFSSSWLWQLGRR